MSADGSSPADENRALTRTETQPISLHDREDAGLQPGATVGRYVVLERVGAGGMGVVYAAFDPELDRRLALKFLHTDREDMQRASRGHARLIREAKAMAKVTHPNVVAVHDVGEFGDQVFVAMEFVAGVTFRKWLGEQSPKLVEILERFSAAGRGLAAAHEKGLAHRDFKPDNVLIAADGRVVVVDFGLARQTSKDERDTDVNPMLNDARTDSLGGNVSLDEPLTMTGSLAGTPAYMAPEQFRGGLTDARSDQFSFCVALWEAVYGTRPFIGRNRTAVGLAVLRGDVQDPPADTAVPKRVELALRRGLSVEPAQRFDDMEALLTALTPRRRRWGGAAVLVAGGLGVAGLAAVYGSGAPQPCEGGKARAAEVWSPNVAQALTAALDDADSPYASAVAEATARSVDIYVSDWARSYRRVCEATSIRREQSEALLDVRMTCLQDGLTALAATLETLTGDSIDPARAAQTMGALPRPTACETVDADDPSVKLPDNPGAAAAVTELRQRRAELYARGLAGRYEDALGDIPQIREAAARLGYAPVQAEIAALEGALAGMAGQHQHAVDARTRAVFWAFASGHDRIYADAATGLVSTVGVAQSNYPAAIDWGWHAAAAVQRVGLGGAEDALLARTMCKLLADKGDIADALPHCQRGVELTAELGGEDSLSYGEALEAIGIAQYYGADYEAASRSFERARDVFFSVKGPNHPDHAQIQNSLAAVCFGMRGAAPCIPEFERALQMSDAAYGPEHLKGCDYANNVASLMVEVGRLDDAARNASRALSVRKAHGQAEHPGVAASLRILADVDHKRGNTAAARTKLQRALQLAIRTRGEEHRDVTQIRTRLEQLEESAGLDNVSPSG